MPSKTDPLSRLRAICMAMPEAVEKVSHGEPTWFAGKGRVFAALDDHHHCSPHLSVWLPAPPGAQQDLVESDPKRFFRPPYVGPSGWIGVVLDTGPDWAMVAWLVDRAYRQVAHKRLVSQLSALGEGQPAADAVKATSRRPASRRKSASSKKPASRKPAAGTRKPPVSRR